MTSSDLIQKLKLSITADEAEKLRLGEGLVISSFNREVCLRLLENDSAVADPVPETESGTLEAELKSYLEEYMQDKPEGHKWIITACLYLTYVEHLPMHPQSAAKWKEQGGRYFCPSMEPDSFICKRCKCEKLI